MPIKGVREILSGHRKVLDDLARLVSQKEVVQGEKLRRMLGKKTPCGVEPAMGINFMVFGAGGVVGPVQGGLILSFVSWRWVFFINSTSKEILQVRPPFSAGCQPRDYSACKAYLQALLLPVRLSMIIGGFKT